MVTETAATTNGRSAGIRLGIIPHSHLGMILGMIHGTTTGGTDHHGTTAGTTHFTIITLGAGEVTTARGIIIHTMTPEVA